MLASFQSSYIAEHMMAGRFLSRGGHIGLFQEEGRFSFEANVDELKRIGLTVSSKLLRLGYVRHGLAREGRAP